MTTEVVHIRKLRRLGDYRLKLWFSDGRAGEWDFSELARRDTPVTRPFRDPAYFDRVFLEQGGLTWPNGYDWSPEALHADMAAAGALKFESAAVPDTATRATRPERALPCFNTWNLVPTEVGVIPRP